MATVIWLISWMRVSWINVDVQKVGIYNKANHLGFFFIQNRGLVVPNRVQMLSFLGNSLCQKNTLSIVLIYCKNKQECSYVELWNFISKPKMRYILHDDNNDESWMHSRFSSICINRIYPVEDYKIMAVPVPSNQCFSLESEST